MLAKFHDIPIFNDHQSGEYYFFKKGPPCMYFFLYHPYIAWAVSEELLILNITHNVKTKDGNLQYSVLIRQRIVLVIVHFL